jgi:hypothetical protein
MPVKINAENRETPQGAAEMAGILWHHANTGETQIWYMDGNKVRRRATVLGEDGTTPALVGPPFSIVGVISPRSDPGGPNIIWHHADTGETQVWRMLNNKVEFRHTVVDEHENPAFVGPPFSIVGTQNVDPGILWHHADTGETQIWYMNGYIANKRATVLGDDGRTPALIGPPFSIVAAGDFNGQQRDDIVWHHANTGETQIWYMDGNKVSRRATVLGEDGRTPALVGPPFSIVGAGDFNGDGRDDIVWHHANTGETQIWFMDGETVKGRATVLGDDGRTPALIGPPFSIVGIGDFTLDRVLPGPNEPH